MKAFFLAAGQGTRLRPLTDDIPKCLIPVRGTPLLGIWLELFRRHGIDEVLINLHWKPEQVRDFVARNAAGLRVRFFEEPSLLGTAGTLAANRDWVRHEDAFWIIYGDIVTNTDLSRMLRFHKETGAGCTIAVVPVADPEQCGIAVVDEDQRVVDFEEKPRNPRGCCGFAGIAVAGACLVEALPNTAPADLAFDVFPRLRGRMRAYRVPGYLGDVGTLENYHRVEQAWRGLDLAESTR